MGDNEHVQPRSRLPACIMVRELKILETNLKFEENITFYLVFLQISTYLPFVTAQNDKREKYLTTEFVLIHRFKHHTL